MIRWLRYDAWIDLLEIALIVALGAGLAHWSSLVAAPRAVAAPGALADAAPSLQGARAERELFGVARAGPSTGRPRPVSSLVLLGVLSGPDSKGRAILAGVGPRPAIVAAGEAIGEGIVLQEVHPDHVIVLRQGAPERIALLRGAPQVSPQLAPQVPPQAVPQPTPQVSPQVSPSRSRAR